MCRPRQNGYWGNFIYYKKNPTKAQSEHYLTHPLSWVTPVPLFWTEWFLSRFRTKWQKLVRQRGSSKQVFMGVKNCMKNKQDIWWIFSYNYDTESFFGTSETNKNKQTNIPPLFNKSLEHKRIQAEFQFCKSQRCSISKRMFCLFKILHQSFHHLIHLSKVRLWWQYPKQGIPGNLLPSLTFQFLLGDLKASTGQARYVISPAGSGFTPRTLPSWAFVKNL